MKFIVINFYSDRFVCKHWRHHNIFKDPLRRETQIFLIFKFHFLICLQIVNFYYTTKYSTSAIRVISRELQSISRLATYAAWLFVYIITSSINFIKYSSSNFISSFLDSKQFIAMNLSLDSSSTESDVFYVERSSQEGCPIRHNTPAILNSTQLSGAMEREVITISSVASPEPRIVTLDSDSNGPTIPYGFGNQQPIVPPSLNDLNFPPNPFNVQATMAVIRADYAYSPQSPEPSILSHISTPPRNVSTIEGWGTAYTTTDDATFYTSDEPRRVYWDISTSDTFDSNEPRNVSVASSPSSTPPPPRRQKRKLSIGMSFPENGGVSQHTCEACGQTLPARKTPWCSGETQTSYTFY